MRFHLRSSDLAKALDVVGNVNAHLETDALNVTFGVIFLTTAQRRKLSDANIYAMKM